MDVETYKRVTSSIRNHRGLSRNCLNNLKKQFPSLSSDTLYSILALEYQKRMRVNHSKSQYNVNRYWGLYQEAIRNGESSGIIVRMAEQVDVCPCLVAKLILGKYFESDKGAEVKVNRYLRDTTLIPDMHLAYEAFLCTLYDNLYSPLSESLRHSLGQQYEIKLHKEAVKLGIAFRDEEHLRKYGYDKTPDIKLEVPVAIDGAVVNWIESKALFADEDAHQEYMKNQYLSYWNRFGPGLVIYWFGYVQTINEMVDKRFIVRDHFPTDVVHLSFDTSVGCE